MRYAFGLALTTLLLAGAIVLGSPGPVFAQQPPPTPAQEGFVSVDQLPRKEELPAARLVMAAYAVVWIAVFGFLWSIWQRLGRVEHELAEAHRRIERGERR